MKKFEEKFSRYYLDSISSIEAKLIVCQQVTDSESLNLLCHTALKAFKRLCTKEDITIYKNKKNALLTQTRTNQLVHYRLSKLLTTSIFAMTTVTDSDFHSRLAQVNNLLSVLRMVMKKVKDDQSVHFQSTCDNFRDFMIRLDYLQDGAKAPRPLLMEILRQISAIQISDTHNLVLDLDDPISLNLRMIADHRFQMEIWQITL